VRSDNLLTVTIKIIVSEMWCCIVWYRVPMLQR